MYRLMIIVIALFFVMVCNGIAEQPTQKRLHGWEIRGTFWSDVNHVDTIKNVPAGYRQVPGHPDDPWRGKISTIPDSTLSPGALVVTSNDFLLLLRAGKGMVSIGPSWVTSGLMPRAGWFGFMDDHYPPPVSNTKEVNQMGFVQRGVGTALVYYASKSRWNPVPGFTFEYDRRRDKVATWFIGCHLTNYRLDIQRGYDRYNSFETLDHKAFAVGLMPSAIFGVKIGDLENTGGISFFTGFGLPFFKLANQAKGASINPTLKSVIVGVGLHFRHAR